MSVSHGQVGASRAAPAEGSPHPSFHRCSNSPKFTENARTCLGGRELLRSCLPGNLLQSKPARRWSLAPHESPPDPPAGMELRAPARARDGWLVAQSRERG